MEGETIATQTGPDNRLRYHAQTVRNCFEVKLNTHSPVNSSKCVVTVALAVVGVDVSSPWMFSTGAGSHSLLPPSSYDSAMLLVYRDELTTSVLKLYYA